MPANPKLGIAQPAQPEYGMHLLWNLHIVRLDFMTASKIVDQTAITPTVGLSHGDAYICTTASPSGGWSGFGLNDICVWYDDGIASFWFNIEPWEGFLVYINDVGKPYMFDGTSWGLYGT
jgi:hypothetical protein